MAKFRELVRGGGQAGVAENMRTVEPKAKYIRKQGVKWNTALPKSKSARKDRILNYIRRHQGQEVQISDMSVDLGYSTNNGAKRFIGQFIDEGLVRAERVSWGSYRFYLTEKALMPHLDKGDARNGEVTVTTPPAVSPVARIEGEKEEQPELFHAEETAVLDNDKTPVKTNENIFAERLDEFIWEFLKNYDCSGAQYQNTALGEVTQALREFSKYIQKRAEESTYEENERRS